VSKSAHYRGDMEFRLSYSPYVLAVGLAGFTLCGLASPLRPWAVCIFLASGTLIFIFHSLKWRLFQERYQEFAVLSGMLPTMITALWLAKRSSFVELGAYLSCFFIAYAGLLYLNRQRIHDAFEKRAAMERETVAAKDMEASSQ
jgi:hypothetical protein